MIPTTLRDYELRFIENVRATHDHGQEMICFPCPFCAARDWYVVPSDEVFHSSSALYCTECERSARFEEKDGQLELVQIAGPLSPEWLPDVRHETPTVVLRSVGRLPEPKAGRLALRVRPTPPPNLRITHSKTENCDMCKYMDRDAGLCEKFNWQVERNELCDDFEARS